MSQQAVALLEQIRALEPQDREWLGMQLLQDEDGGIDDLTEDPEFYEEMVRRLNDPSPGFSWEGVQRDVEAELEKIRAEPGDHATAK